MNKKKILLSGIILATALSLNNTSQLHAEAASPVKSAVTTTMTSGTVIFKLNNPVYVNGQGKHRLNAAPFVVKGTSMIPLRAAAESLGCTVNWNPKKGTLELSGPSLGTVQFTRFSDYAINAKGERVKLPEQIRQVKGVWFVPARSLSTLLNANLTWDAGTHTLTIARKEAVQEPKQFSFLFNKDTEGWKGGFADLPVNYDKTIYELKYNRELLPLQNNKTNYGLQLSGHNRSDDLFMFLSRGIGGFKPNTTYDVKLNFAMYTDAAGGSIGIGGSPAESLFIKAGILTNEPLSVPTEYAGGKYYRMNVDTGSQGTGGKEIKVIGNAAKPESDKPGYQRVDFHYNAKVKTNAKGVMYVLIGADSGFEGLTTLYFDDIQVTATAQK
ncbi:stalk domain-containing protein [Paenibacillus sp. GCM10012306]|uniref:stalk domain-containing protein n=1 Tax=Paenibacillus sp. GCM10012306 TaxID=3317342 RepID=UPI00360A06F8